VTGCTRRQRTRLLVNGSRTEASETCTSHGWLAVVSSGVCRLATSRSGVAEAVTEDVIGSKINPYAFMMFIPNIECPASEGETINAP